MFRRPSRSTVSRLAVVAVGVLGEALDAADYGPVERTALHKLALGYLMLVGVAAPYQVRVLWEILGHEGSFAHMSDRQSHSGVILDGIRQRAKALASSHAS
jgi:hypothetical protein